MKRDAPAPMVELNKIEKRVLVIVLVAFLAVLIVRWRQVESARVELGVQSEAADVQR